MPYIALSDVIDLIRWFPLTPKQFVDIINLEQRGVINRSVAKIVMREMIDQNIKIMEELMALTPEELEARIVDLEKAVDKLEKRVKGQEDKPDVKVEVTNDKPGKGPRHTSLG